MSHHSSNVYKLRPARGVDKILVVDDDATTRKIIKKILNLAGHDVTEATSGLEALHYIYSMEFTLILLDIVMPDMDGIEVLKKAREHYSMLDLPIIMVTIKGDSQDLGEALSLGASDYIVKPIDAAILNARVENRLSHKALEDELLKTRNELEERVKERTSTLVEINELLKDEVVSRKKAEAEVNTSNEYLKSLIENAKDIIAVFESDGTVYFESPSIERILGYHPDERRGKITFDIIHPEDRQSVINKFALAFATPGEVFTEVARFQHKDGSWRILETTGNTAMIHGKLRGIVNARDITERSRIYGQLSYKESHDELTSLYNRKEFNRQLEYSLENSRIGGSEVVLCYLDLDRFRVINESCGNKAGDELLKSAGQLLRSELRKQDVIARLGDDEFGVLLMDCSLEQAYQVAKKLLDTVEGFRFHWDGKTFSIGLSIGLVSIAEQSFLGDNVLEHAEAACLAAHESGGNQIYIYQESDITLSLRKDEVNWVSQINHALENDLFCLYMQPIVPVTSDNQNNQNHFEILLRMKGEGADLIAPSLFLPVAEKYNLSVRLDRWVIAQAFQWLVGNKEYLDNLSYCAINLSGKSFGNNELLDFIIKSFKTLSLPPEKICFEVTETAAIANIAQATLFIKTLKDLGCSFALDDFGSGMSSFGYLKNLPVDFLKIDGMFVKKIGADPLNQAIVRSIHEIGKAAGKHTIAEFVEDENILDILKDIGVDFAQGYHIGRPIPLDDLQTS